MTRFAALFFANVFMLFNKLFGIERSMAIIKKFADKKINPDIDLDIVSKNLQYLYDNYSLVILGRKQKCLWRGYVLYFYAKRANMPIKLIFGAKADEEKTDNALDWHCWIENEHGVCFERSDVIKAYTPFIEYS